MNHPGTTEKHAGNNVRVSSSGDTLDWLGAKPNQSQCRTVQVCTIQAIERRDSRKPPPARDWRCPDRVAHHTSTGVISRRTVENVTLSHRKRSKNSHTSLRTRFISNRFRRNRIPGATPYPTTGPRLVLTRRGMGATRASGDLHRAPASAQDQLDATTDTRYKSN